MVGQNALTFDLAMLNAQEQLKDAASLPQRIKPLTPPLSQQQPGVQMQVGPMMGPQQQAGPLPPPGPGGPPPMQMNGMQVGAQAPVGPGNMQAQAQFGPGMGFQGAQVGGQMPVGPGNMQTQAQFGPGMNFQGAQVGGQAPVADGQASINAAFDNMLKLQALQAQYEQNGFAARVGKGRQGPSASLSYEDDGLRLEGGADGDNKYARASYRKNFAEGGLAARYGL